MSKIARRRLLALIVASTAAASLAGCGGNGNSGSGSSHVRAVDASTEGGTVNVLVNSTSLDGNLNFFQTTGYLFIKPGTSDFGYTSSTPLLSGVIPIVNNVGIAADNYYSAIMIGRPDVAQGDTKSARVDVLTDESAPSGSAAVRFLDAAPDAGPISVAFNSGATNYVFGQNSSYVNVPGGTYTVTVTETTAPNTVIVNSQSITLNNNTANTVYICEPLDSNGTPTVTYNLQQSQDS